MMRDIYSSATRVTIWLGEEDEDSDVAFDSLHKIIGTESWPADLSTCSILRRHSGSFYFQLTARRSWLSRVWILQELAMSTSDPIVVCGHKSAPWSIFIAAWQAIAKEALAVLGTRPKVSTSTTAATPSTDDDFEVLNLTKLDILNDLRVATQKRGGDSLKRLLTISKSSAATDPRDRIYGLLGLLEKEARDPKMCISIPVDYQKPCSETYTNAMAHIFSRGEGPYFLSGVFLSGGPTAAPHVISLPSTTVQPDLPSWVPDFTWQNFDKTTQPEGWHFHPPTTMHASGAGRGARNGTVLGDGRTLQVEGLIHLKSGYDPAPSTYEAMYRSLLSSDPSSPVDGLDHSHLTHAPNPNDYEEILRSRVGKMSFFTSTNGFVGTCVPASRVGDSIVIVFGSPSPFVLRPVPEANNKQQAHWLIGSSYVGGIMNGEMVDELYCEDLMDSTTFLLR
ncbi:hypothetical protein IQ06DRAFT_219023 [Phaeosphaeriaceae sp. SRC1lsM3a]|nr:hypothetical protein IQ06DRAFT_219023 [Stagonospora sp. SRC1lsM3a]